MCLLFDISRACMHQLRALIGEPQAFGHPFSCIFDVDFGGCDRVVHRPIDQVELH